jgi:hypothetical protein
MSNRFNNGFRKENDAHDREDLSGYGLISYENIFVIVIKLEISYCYSLIDFSGIIENDISCQFDLNPLL